MMGLARFSEICAAVDVPVIGIGGITVECLSEVLEAGAYGVAVLSAVVCQDDPRAAARAFADEIARVTQ